MAGQYRGDYAAAAWVWAYAHAEASLQTKNDGGPLGMWFLSGDRGAHAQFLCLPRGVGRPALLFLPFFSSCASFSTGRVEVRMALLNKKLLAIS